MKDLSPGDRHGPNCQTEMLNLNHIKKKKNMLANCYDSQEQHEVTYV